jgi:hypothetical protein
MGQMKSVFGFEAVYATGIRNNYFSYYWNREQPVTITGYDIFFRMDAYRNLDGMNLYEKELKTELGKVKLIFSHENKLTVQKDDQVIYQYELNKLVRGLYEKYGSNFDGGFKPEPVNASDREKLIWNDETDQVKIMIIFNNIHGTVNIDKNELSIDNISGDVFLKVK